MLSLIYICHCNIFPNMFLIPRHLRIFQHIEQYQHGDCGILADGIRIWHLECCYCITPVLDRRPRPSYPSCSFRAYLHSFLLDSNQSHPMPVIWRNFIWMFRSRIKCSFYTAANASWWRLWEWFQWRLTNTLTAGSLNTPCVQYGACIFRPSLLYTTSTTWPVSPWHPVISSQTSLLMSILQWWPKSQHLPSMHGHFQQFQGYITRTLWRWGIIKWGWGFPDSTYGQWILVNRDSPRKTILHTWEWVTK